MADGIRGPDAVRQALIESATELFARQGDASVRAVATAAGVNHGLVHHYFGGKAGLRRAVLDRLATQMAAAVTAAPSYSLADLSRAALALAEDDPRMVKILARALLDGEVPEALQTSFPVMRKLLAASSGDPHRTKTVLAQNLATALGALVFGPWIRAALDLDSEAFDTIRRDGIERNLAELEAM